MESYRCFEALAVALVLGAAATDLSHRRIPNSLLLLALCFAAFLHAPPGDGAWPDMLSGGATGLALFLPMYVLGGMAAGDVKLMATVGAVLGPAAAFKIALASFCAGGLLAVLMLAASGRWQEGWRGTLNLGRWLQQQPRPGHHPAGPRPASIGSLPYAVAVALGTVAVLFGQRM